MKTNYRYASLEDFLISHRLTVDETFDDVWGASFPVKGIELDASILFADISGFSRRTAEMSPVETLIFVNNFFAWISAEAIKDQPCIVDKYIGDEVMLLFAKEFGCDDPFESALRTARGIADRDALSFCPHIGIASGRVIAGYVGTPLKYSASLFGAPVALAARCASIKPEEKFISSYITFPASEWGNRDLASVFPPRKYEHPEKGVIEQPHAWTMKEPRNVPIKNMGEIEVHQIVNQAMWFPQQSAEDRARACAAMIAKSAR
jgi:class 3 adenylate cyclase